jgi:hypothetical protein
LIKNRKRIGIIVGLILIIGIVGWFLLVQPQFSTVETTFGTVQYDLVDSGITNIDNLATTEIIGGYLVYSIKSGADVGSVNPSTISIEDAPTGTSFGYSLAFMYDNVTTTNEIVFVVFEIQATDVRWDFVKVFTGGGAIIKQMDIEPKTGTATFFIFLDGTELESQGSIYLQFTGWHYAFNKVVAVTSYLEINYSYAGTDETITTELPDYQQIKLDPVFIPLAIIVLALIRKYTKKE